MNTLLEKLGSNATTNAIIITDVGTLKEAFSLWAAEKRELSATIHALRRRLQTVLT